MEYFKEYKAGLGILTGTEALRKILLSKELSIWTGSAIYKRDTIIGNGLDFTERCESGEDQEFIYKALSKSNVVYFIDKVLSYYFLREGYITNSISIKNFDAINALVRASDYLKAQGISTEIIQHIRVNRTIETYISGKTSCIQRSHHMNRYLKELDAAIDANCPGLTSRIEALANEIPLGNLRLLLRIKILQLSPQLYFIASRIINRS